MLELPSEPYFLSVENSSIGTSGAPVAVVVVQSEEVKVQGDFMNSKRVSGT